MKKIFALVLALCMLLALAACGAPKTSEYKLGMGISLNMNSSKENNAQVDATVATVVLDKDGKIVAAKIDVAQNKMNVTDGQIEAGKEFLSKKELKEDYGMSKIGAKEWYIQAEAFEQYVIGKTGAEVSGMETVVNDSGHTVTTDEALYASCSISISDFIEAIAKACNDEQGMSFQSDGNFKLGLAVNSEVDAGTKAATAEEDGVVKMYSEFGAVVLGADGKILAAVTDATQPQIAITAAGQIGETKFGGTKRELKEGYNMVAYSNATLEWYQQARNFVEFAVGKTPDELTKVETKINDEGHTVFADEALYASVSISIDGMTAVLVKAANNAA